MILPDECEIFDFSKEYNPRKITEFINNGGRAVGGYLEKRVNMYVAPQYQNQRNIHLGIDFWGPAGEPVFAPFAGKVAYMDNHEQEGNYGPAIVLKHSFSGKPVYALYGHLSLKSLENLKTGRSVKAGDVVGWLGNESENGNWPPHLHYQMSFLDPGKADMPGVVDEKEANKAIKIYPDPRFFIGEIYD